MLFSLLGMQKHSTDALRSCEPGGKQKQKKKQRGGLSGGVAAERFAAFRRDSDLGWAVWHYARSVPSALMDRPRCSSKSMLPSIKARTSLSPFVCMYSALYVEPASLFCVSISLPHTRPGKCNQHPTTISSTSGQGITTISAALSRRHNWRISFTFHALLYRRLSSYPP